MGTFIIQRERIIRTVELLEIEASSHEEARHLVDEYHDRHPETEILDTRYELVGSPPEGYSRYPEHSEAFFNG